MTIEAMKQALEALECLFGIPEHLTGKGGGDVAVWRLGGSYRAQQAIPVLRQAIAEAEKHEVYQEPVAWIDDEGEFQWIKKIDNPEHTAFYIHPQPKREPLTDEQIAEFFGVKAVDESFVDFVRAIEAAHGITSDMKQEHVDKTAKQRHEWVGLTHAEAKDLVDESCRADLLSLTRKVEAKFKEKNT